LSQQKPALSGQCEASPLTCDPMDPMAICCSMFDNVSMASVSYHDVSACESRISKSIKQPFQLIKRISQKKSVPTSQSVLLTSLHKSRAYGSDFHCLRLAFQLMCVIGTI